MAERNKNKSGEGRVPRHPYKSLRYLHQNRHAPWFPDQSDFDRPWPKSSGSGSDVYSFVITGAGAGANPRAWTANIINPTDETSVIEVGAILYSNHRMFDEMQIGYKGVCGKYGPVYIALNTPHEIFSFTLTSTPTIGTPTVWTGNIVDPSNESTVLLTGQTIVGNHSMFDSLTTGDKGVCGQFGNFYVILHAGSVANGKIEYTIDSVITASTNSPHNGKKVATVTIEVATCGRENLIGTSTEVVDNSGCLFNEENSALVGRYGWAHWAVAKDTSEGAGPNDRTPCHWSADGLCCP